jgi:hypothetical protein
MFHLPLLLPLGRTRRESRILHPQACLAAV